MGGGMGGLARQMMVALLLSACASTAAIGSRNAVSLTETVVQSGLTVPSDIAFSSDGRMIVTERPGTIGIFASGAPGAKRLAGAQVAGIRAMGEAGLLSLALDPNFDANALLFVCASLVDEGEWRNEVLRYRLVSGSLSFDGYVIREGIAAAAVQASCRIRFGPDRRLWVLTGDSGVPTRAQDPGSLNGKLLRVERDGSVPPDNPIVGNSPAPTLVYALGLRNRQALAFQPGGEGTYVIDPGEGTQDEIDLVEAGANFGWPLVSGYGGAARGFADPLWTSGSASYGLAGAAFVSGAAWGTWSGSLVVATLGAQALRRFVEASRLIAKEILLAGKYGRLRAVAAAPDGTLYVATSNGNSDRIIRLTAASVARRDAAHPQALPAAGVASQ